MRTIRLLSVLTISVFSAACLQSAALITINADGSGTVEQRSSMTAAALAQIRLFAGSFGQPGGKPIDPFSEQEARKLAGQMGDGVTFVSSTPITTAAAEGRINVYRFPDITKLRFNGMPNAPGNTNVRVPDTPLLGNRSTGITFEFVRTPEGHSLVTLHMPGQAVDELLKPEGTARSQTIQPEQLAMMRQMFAGMKISIQVQPTGRLVRTNSSYVDGQVVTLFDLDLDELLKDDGVVSRLQAAKTKEELTALMASIPGLKAQLGDVTIEFTGK